LSFVSKRKDIKRKRGEVVIGSSSFGNLIAEIIQENGKYFFVVRDATGFIYDKKPCKNLKEARSELAEFNRMRMALARRRGILFMW